MFELMPLALTLLAAVGYGLAWYRLSRYAWMLPASAPAHQCPAWG